MRKTGSDKRPSPEQLRTHLEGVFGIQVFPELDQHDRWMYQTWNIQKRDRLYRRLHRFQRSPQQPEHCVDFYDHIADPAMTPIIHSLKGMVILRSIWIASRFVPMTGSVLELGCHTGHGLLTLAELMPGPSYRGVDLSSRAIEQARLKAEERGLTNTEFQVQDLTVGLPGDEHDLVIDLQTTQYLHGSPGFWQNLGRLVRPGGWLLSIPSGIGELSDVIRHAHRIRSAGLGILGHTGLYSIDDAHPQVHPVFLAGHLEGPGLDDGAIEACRDAYLYPYKALIEHRDLDDPVIDTVFDLDSSRFEHGFRCWHLEIDPGSEIFDCPLLGSR